jgi:hypothetical protein
MASSESDTARSNCSQTSSAGVDFGSQHTRSSLPWWVFAGGAVLFLIGGLTPVLVEGTVALPELAFDLAMAALLGLMGAEVWLREAPGTNGRTRRTIWWAKVGAAVVAVGLFTVYTLPDLLTRIGL